MSWRVLVAGVGNVFLGDDGFGVSVVDRLSRREVPEGVRVADFGIRGVHLAYELLNGYDAVVLVDAVPRGEEAGALYVIEADLDSREPVAAGPGVSAMDAHGMDPDTVLSLFTTLGGTLERALVVGCEPADCSEGMGLSAPVEASVGAAVELVREVLVELSGSKEADGSLC